MAVLFGLRFDFRNPAFAGTAMADRYAAALDMAAWADGLGCASIVVSEHHGSADGYLPSPVPMVAAMAARTAGVRFMIAALIAPFHDPLRLAEDLLVLDNLSRGRVDVLVAGGYVPDEFALFGVPMAERGRRVEETVRVLRGAFTGEAFEFRGRTVHLTPVPHRPGGPSILLGGTSEAAARRAARIADGFIPSDPAAWDFYRDEAVRLGHADPGPAAIGPSRTVALAEDTERGWDDLGPYFLHEMNAYGAWQAASGLASPYHLVADLDELRASGQYAVLTPPELIQELRTEPVPFVLLHPLCGGTPPELAWQSMRLLEHEVLPAFA